MPLRDPTTAAYFNCEVVLQGAQEYELNGHVLDAASLAKLTGAPDGSVLTARLTDDGDFEVEIENSMLVDLMQRTIVNMGDETFLVSNDIFILKPAFRGGGIGVRSFAIEAKEALRLGISMIVTKAAGRVGDEFSGWFLWPRSGFQADLTETEMAKLKLHEFPPLRKAATLHDLMQSKEGVQWWRENGSGRHMEFDLSPGSTHWVILNAYLLEKGALI